LQELRSILGIDFVVGDLWGAIVVKNSLKLDSLVSFEQLKSYLTRLFLSIVDPAQRDFKTTSGEYCPFHLKTFVMTLQRIHVYCFILIFSILTIVDCRVWDIRAIGSRLLWKICLGTC
jgi:hypothetical protein